VIILTMDFNSIKIPSHNTPVCWFEISEHMQLLSQTMRNNNGVQTKEHLVKIFEMMLHICGMYKLDMNKSWDRWHKKACTKKYDSV